MFTNKMEADMNETVPGKFQGQEFIWLLGSSTKAHLALSVREAPFGALRARLLVQEACGGNCLLRRFQPKAASC